jgi:phenylalanyl-tRNA synthetase beta chain
MKLSLNLAQCYSNVDIKSTGIDRIVSNIGSQLGAIEEVIDIGIKYQDIVVARVVSCAKHENADKLHVCLIDDGGVVEGVERNSDGLVQVVCGAPNVREGLTVAWLPPGVIVPSTIDKDPFTLEAREIRGVVSNGMLASPSELDISESHEGLLEIDQDDVGQELMEPGTPFRKLYNLDDVVIDLENKMFTHRPDCFGILGIARELAGIQGDTFVSPDWYIRSSKNEMVSNSLNLNVQVEDLNLVPRFMAVAIDNVNVKPSPIWLQSALTRLGVNPINNVVDITNYYSHLTGQPLHAYDYDKIKNMSTDEPTIIARQAREGDEVLLLNGKTLKVEAPTVVIATDKKVLGVGGIMGGKESEVDLSTTKIVLECANFDMYNIRRSSMKYGLFTDAVTRYTKGQSVYQCDRVINKAISDINAFSGGEQASEVFDLNSGLHDMESIKVGVDFVNSRLGTDISADKMKQILDNVEFEVDIQDGNLIVDYPFWRQDIKIAEDVVEEIGRIYGYHKISAHLPKKSIIPSQKNPMLELKNQIRKSLSAAGASELLTYSFVHANLITDAGQDVEKSFKLNNALSPELHYYRQSILPSLLSKVHNNIKSGFEEFALFEIGKVHVKGVNGEDSLPLEAQKLAFIFSCSDKLANQKYSGSPYYIVKKYLEYILSVDGATPKYVKDKSKSVDEFNRVSGLCMDSARSSIVYDSTGNEIGSIGEIRTSIKKKLKLPVFTAGFEINLQKIATSSNKYQPLAKFPSSDQDLTLAVDTGVSYASVFETINKRLHEISENNGYISVVEPVDIYSAEGSNLNNYTFSLSIRHPNRTLVREEVSRLLNEISSVADNDIGAKRV